MESIKSKLFVREVAPDHGRDELSPAREGIHVGYVVHVKERDDRDGTEYTVETWFELLEAYENVEPVTRYRPVGVRHEAR